LEVTSALPNDRLVAALAGRYRLEREVGAGGMATVYLAADLKHPRKVAVKVLRPELAASLGPERFLREIEIAAQLQHPHILPLLDSGEAAGFLYFVMPFVEGESLRDRLARAGELPVHEAVRILIQVVDALAHAHSRGLVHRDIKPENVLLSGRHAMVTDFGVAKALSEATGRQQVTTAGVALGTPAYMAPEQAAADPHLDHRVDLYAAGVVAYELLAGRPPFTGVSTAEVLGAHVTRMPERVSAHRPSVSPALEAVIMKCLQKRPADRWQSAEELLSQLEPLLTPSGGTTPTGSRPIAALAPEPADSRHRIAILGGAAGLIALGVIGWLALRGGRGDDGPGLDLGARTQVTLDPGLELDPALSPDGQVVAYVAGPPGDARLFVRQLSSGGAAVPVAPDLAARAPRWSPDGSRIMFTSPRGLEVVPFMGGATNLLVSSRSVQGADWSPDGRQIAYVITGAPDTLFTRPVDGTTAVRITAPGEVASPVWSPDGRWIAYSVGNGRFLSGVRDLGNLAPASIWIVPAAGGTPIRVSDSTSLNVSPAWFPSAPNRLLFVSSVGGSRDVYAMRIGAQGRPDGAPRRLTTGLNAHSISIPRTGDRLAYTTYLESVNAWRLRVPAGGPVSIAQAEPVTRERQIIEFFRVSPDGRALVFDSDRGGRQHIYRMPIGGGDVQQLTTGDWDDFAPVWSPDGRWIAFHSARSGDRDVFVIPAAGGTPEQLTRDPGREWMVDWSPTATRLTFAWGSSVGLVSGGDRWAAPERVDSAALRPGTPVKWSPDGRSIAFYGTGGVRLLTPGAGPSRVLVAGTFDASFYLGWSEDGRTVFYEATDAEQRRAIWAAPVSGGGPRELIRFDDPSKQATRFTLDVNGGWIYLTLGDRQADISVVELLAR
jgi:serine/threonine-protein kinase